MTLPFSLVTLGWGPVPEGEMAEGLFLRSMVLVVLGFEFEVGDDGGGVGVWTVD